MFAKFSPDGDARRLRPREQHLRRGPRATARSRALTDRRLGRRSSTAPSTGSTRRSSACATASAGAPTASASPTGSSTPSGVREFHADQQHRRALPAASARSSIRRSGQTNSACRVGRGRASAAARRRWLDVPGDPRNHYIARMDWAASSDEIVLQQLNRLQNTNRVMLGDAATGEVRDVLTEQDDAWVDVHDELEWLDDGKRVHLDQRARRLAARLPRLARSASEVKLLTPGRVRRDRARSHVDEEERLALLHRLARQPDAAVPLPGAARRHGRRRAADAGGPAGHARLPDLARRRAGRSTRWSVVRRAAGRRAGQPAGARDGAHAGRQRRRCARSVDELDARPTRVLPRRHRRRRAAGRLVHQAARLRSREEVSRCCSTSTASRPGRPCSTAGAARTTSGT